MKTKQLIRGDVAQTIVDDMLDGLVLAQPHLTLVKGHKVVLHRDFQQIRSRQVTLLSGGGSGHEPAHAGYIGEGMLTGVICGNVFASPTTLQVLTALRLVAGTKGCLVIVKNYTGDRLNFGLAVEQAKSEGLLVDMVIVDDDVSIENARAGRRGLCGTVLVHKLAGAAAANGSDLKSLVSMINNITRYDTLGTIGVALRPCTLPGHESPTRILGDDEMELGLGIHGEPGIETSRLQHVAPLTRRMIERLCASLSIDISTARVVLMVNNLGTMTTMELFVVVKYAMEELRCKGIKVERVLVGSLMTALDMYGFSLTFCNVSTSDAEMLLKFIDIPTTATAWNFSPYNDNGFSPQQIEAPDGNHPLSLHVRPSSLNPEGRLLERCVQALCENLINAEPHLTQWDAQVGDGDCGHTFKAAAQKILSDMAISYPLHHPAALLRAIAASVSVSAGGTSGVLYTIMLTAAAVELESQADVVGPLTNVNWPAAFHMGVIAIQRYGGAREGNRTMLDALLPADRVLQENSNAIEAVATAAEAGAEKTRTIPTSVAFGRSGYVEEACGTNVPDPGAMAVAIWVRAIVNTLKRNV